MDSGVRAEQLPMRRGQLVTKMNSQVAVVGGGAASWRQPADGVSRLAMGGSGDQPAG